MFGFMLAVIYLSFISLGLPDSMLGAAWPMMYEGFGVPLSYAGIISMIIAMGTVVSSLMSDRLTRKLGTGKVTMLSVALTALALLGFSLSNSFIALCLIAVPYGLGAGSVDASLNNYVALHYESRHMSWLHCMWGVGASAGPLIMGAALAAGQGWSMGYRYVALIQMALTVVLILSVVLSGWKKAESGEGAESGKALGLKQVVSIKGSKEVMLCFFCYCALEQTAGLWSASYLVLSRGVDSVLAARFASLFFIGITAGRGLNGFLTFKFRDIQLIRMGMGVIALGTVCLLMPWGVVLPLGGLILIGVGCAPIYPCIIHSTPDHFGRDRSQAIIGIQMASAYVGTCLMPPLFGLIASNVSIKLFPVFLLMLLLLMAVMSERLEKLCPGERDKQITNDKL